MKTYSFPKDFLWGTATSAHQIEGDNTNSDWWAWEQSKYYPGDRVSINEQKPVFKEDREYPLEPSGKACDSYNRYKEDFDLAVGLNNNAIRISVEWARLEPKQNEFSEKEFAHYRRVLSAAKKRGLKTFVTLHHFTNPIWFAEKGGWTNLRVSKMFAKYSKKCAEELGDLVDTFITINEPQVYTLQGYTNGMWPPNKINPILSFWVQVNMAKAHKAAYSAIKSVNKNYQVGIVKNIVWYQTYSRRYHFLDKLAVKFLYFLGNGFFLNMLGKKIDFIGLNYYFSSRVRHLRIDNPNDWVSDLGWWIYPSGLERILLYLGKKYPGLPIYITENGLADSDDKNRIKFLKEMLTSISSAIKKGVGVKGYFHWSLLDNYEWHHGFWPRFGLVKVDREGGLKRKPRKSYYEYAKICGSNEVLS